MLLLDRVRVSTRRLLLCVVEFVVVEFSRQSETDDAKIYAGVGARGARNMVRLEPFERLGRSVSRASENRGRSGEVEGEVEAKRIKEERPLRGMALTKGEMPLAAL